MVILEENAAEHAGKSNRMTHIDYNSWGNDIDEKAHEQMRQACSLPISRYAALMPDAHPGYGLPIGGVLAVSGSIIPYAVGVDIACRVMVSVLDVPTRELSRKPEFFEEALREETRFGVGAKWKNRKSHAVMEEDWGFAPAVKSLRDLAWSQLGTSGSGNHFVEFGILSLEESIAELEPGEYTAMVSHSGSRGSGSRIADHYSRLAMSLHPELPRELRHLSWLPMSNEGAEYFEAMTLMGKYASANHHIIHDSVIRNLSARRIFMVENHHNFAWKEIHHGEELIVHRKGATPAFPDMPAYIPGSMVDPGFIVEGTGNSASLFSCAHGAGRKISRRAASKTIKRIELDRYLRDKGVRLISAGLDEAPQVYKNIRDVMQAQKTLIKARASFIPKIVKMAPHGERPED